MNQAVTRALDRCFQLSAHGTTLPREILTGLTTFAAMAYILAVLACSDFLGLDLGYLWIHVGTAFVLVLALLLVDLFPSMGKLPGVCQRGGLVD